MGSNLGEDLDVCKCIVPLRHGGTLNSRRAASPLVWLVEEEKSRLDYNIILIIYVVRAATAKARLFWTILLSARMSDDTHLAGGAKLDVDTRRRRHDIKKKSDDPSCPRSRRLAQKKTLYI
ncbi:hypothetical protein TNCV_1418311 [Trichonephila clavipes]|nr:hypothetical protein TNCV_1418311 [Trichonephila clavipes]